jgi:hypothetical protein
MTYESLGTRNEHLIPQNNQTVPSLFHQIFSERNFGGNPISFIVLLQLREYYTGAKFVQFFPISNDE